MKIKHHAQINQKLSITFFSLSLILSLLTVACSNNQSRVTENNDNNQQNQNQTNNQTLFSCQKDPQKTEEETWLVNYQTTPDKINTWLNLTQTNIKSDNLEKSCQEIAQTLDKLTKEGLFKMSYNLDPNNPNNYLLCGETKSNPNNCSLITTLKVKENIDQTFQEIAQPLFTQGQTFQKVSGGTSITYSTQETTNNINLTPHLTGENLDNK